MHNQQRYNAREVLHEGDTQIINADKICFSVGYYFMHLDFFYFQIKQSHFQ